MKISILLATFNRNEILKKTLQGYSSLDVSGITLDIVCVDNACLASTQTLISSFPQLPIKYIECAKPGKNASLNKGLEYITGDYIILTDDDAIPHENWLQEYAAAFFKYADIPIFGGGISPYCKHWPAWLDATNPQIQGALVIRESPNCDNQVEPTYIWGPNMAVNKKVFDDGFSFNEDIGPNGTDYIMGSETEFLGRLAKAGYKAMFLQNVLVNHQIREEQLTLKWLKGRALRQGKGIARHKAEHGQYDLSVRFMLGVPRYLLSQYVKNRLLLLVKRFTNNDCEYASLLFQTYWLKGQLIYLKENPLTHKSSD